MGLIGTILTIFGLPLLVLAVNPLAIAPPASTTEDNPTLGRVGADMALAGRYERQGVKIAGLAYKEPAQDPLWFLSPRWVNAAKNIGYLAIPGLFAFLFMELIDWSEERGSKQAEV